MNIREQKAREGLLILLTPFNSRHGMTLAEAKATKAALDFLGFGPTEIYVTPLVTGVVAADKFPISEVERYGFEEDGLNYSSDSPNFKGFILALRREVLMEEPKTAYARIFDEEFPGHGPETLKEAKLAMPGVQEAITAHIARGVALAFPPEAK